MNWAEAIVLIMIVTGITKVLRTAIMAKTQGKPPAFIDPEDRRRELRHLSDHGASPAEAPLQREVEDLRERIKVLERIATEDRKARDLADEIEALRHP